MKHLLRDLLTLATGASAAAVLLWAGLATRPDPSVIFRGSVSSLPDLAGFAAAVAGAALALWWSAALALAIVSAALQKAGRPVAAAVSGACAPAFMKRIAAAAIGLNLVTGIGAAHAADSLSPGPPPLSISALQRPADVPVHPNFPGGQRSNELFQPEMDTAAGAAAVEPPTPHWKPRTPQPSESPDNVFIRPGRAPDSAQTVVREGDSLWSLAAAQLGPLATDEQIAAHWPRWHESNRSIIGDRPDLILPGQVLDIPDLPEEPRK